MSINYRVELYPSFYTSTPPPKKKQCPLTSLTWTFPQICTDGYPKPLLFHAFPMYKNQFFMILGYPMVPPKSGNPPHWIHPGWQTKRAATWTSTLITSRPRPRTRSAPLHPLVKQNGDDYIIVNQESYGFIMTQSSNTVKYPWSIIQYHIVSYSIIL